MPTLTGRAPEVLELITEEWQYEQDIAGVLQINSMLVNYYTRKMVKLGLVQRSIDANNGKMRCRLKPKP